MSERRELILQLGQMITDRIGHKVTTEDPEYWGLACIVTDEMAEVALKMKVRKPMTFEQMLKATGKEEKKLQELLDEMSRVGLIEYNWENPKREKQYVLPMFVPGSAEFTNMNKQQLEEHPELGRFFERMSRLPLEKVTPMVPPGGAGIGMHVIPVEKAIEMENQSIDIEHISHWLKKYDGKYAASPCSCRMSRQTYDEGCADDPEDWCIAVGDMADYVVETNKGGRYITYDEVMEILKRAEDNGFVHQITNIDGENKIFAICNCTVNVCYALRTSQLFNTPNMSRSAYVARVETQDCVACGRCVEYCPAGAVKLGQKLCTKDGPVSYPKHELPDGAKWGPEKWDEDYRDKNRINCYDTGTAPCKTACPAHIAVQGYIKLAAQGKYRDALELIKKNNPFPAVCGHICNRRCEDACSRADVDEPVAIDEIKKFIAEQELREENRYVPKMQNPQGEKYGRKIAVVGGGPGGLSCAFYLQQRGYDVTVFEKNDRPGGMLVFGIPAFRLEKDVVEAEIEVLRQMGVEFRTNTEVGKDITIRELRMQGYEAFYLAIGAQGGRRLGVEGEDASGVLSGVEFLRKMNLHEALKLEGRTVVVGGGNVAIDVARTAVRAGSSEVGLYCLESEKEMPAQEEEQQEAKEEGVSLNHGWGPKRILAEDGKVKGIEFKRCTRVFDEEHRFHPQYDEADTVIVECDNILVSIGQSIQWGTMLDGTRVRVRRNQAAMADEKTYQTGEPDIFVGGDAYTGPKFAIDAIAAGKEAAESIHRYVQPGQSLLIGRPAGKYHELDKENVDWDSFDHTPRQQPKKPDPAKAKETMRDLRGTFTEEQVKKETERCLGCGATVVDQNVCVGCGICTTKCKFDAVHLERRYDAHEVPYEKLIVNHMAPTLMKRGAKIAARKAKDITLSRKRRQN